MEIPNFVDILLSRFFPVLVITNPPIGMKMRILKDLNIDFDSDQCAIYVNRSRVRF